MEVIEKPKQYIDDDKIYIGHWSVKTGKQHGIGVLILPDGTTYNCSWKNGLMHGYGRVIFNDGDYYEG
jgi:hypothetical protein